MNPSTTSTTKASQPSAIDARQLALKKIEEQKQKLEMKLKKEAEEKKKKLEEERKKKIEEAKLKKNQDSKGKAKTEQLTESTKNVSTNKEQNPQQSLANKLVETETKEALHGDANDTNFKAQTHNHENSPKKSEADTNISIHQQISPQDTRIQTAGDQKDKNIESDDQEYSQFVQIKKRIVRDQENIDANKMQNSLQSSQNIKQTLDMEPYSEKAVQNQEYTGFSKLDKVSSPYWTLNENKGAEDHQESQGYKNNSHDQDSDDGEVYREDPTENANNLEPTSKDNSDDTQEYEEEIQEEEDEEDQNSHFAINQQSDPLKSYENLKSQRETEIGQENQLPQMQTATSMEKFEQNRNSDFALDFRLQQPKTVGQSLNENYQSFKGNENLKSVDRSEFELSSQNIYQSNRYERLKSIPTDSLQEASFQSKPEITQQKFLPPISNTRIVQVLPATSDSNTGNIRKLQNNFMYQSSEKQQKKNDNFVAQVQQWGTNATCSQQKIQPIDNSSRQISNEKKTQTPKSQDNAATQDKKLTEKDKLLLKMEIDSKIKRMMNEKAQQQKQQEDNRMKMKQNVMSQLYGWQEKREIAVVEPHISEIAEDDAISSSIQSKINWKEIEELPIETKNTALRASGKQTEIRASKDSKFSHESKYFPGHQENYEFQGSSYDTGVDAQNREEITAKSICKDSQKLDFGTHQATQLQVNTAHFNTFGQNDNRTVSVDISQDDRKSSNRFASQNFQSKDSEIQSSDKFSQKLGPHENVSQLGYSSPANFGFEEYTDGGDHMKFSQNHGGSPTKNALVTDLNYDNNFDQIRQSKTNLPPQEKDITQNSTHKEFSLSAQPSAKSASRYQVNASNTHYSRDELSNSPKYNDEGNYNYQITSNERYEPNKAKETKKEPDYDNNVEDIAEDLDGGFEEDEVVTGTESKSHYDYNPIPKTNEKSQQLKGNEEGTANNTRTSGTRKTWQKQPSVQENDFDKKGPISEPTAEKIETENIPLKPTKIIISNDEDEEARERKQKKFERFLKRKEEERQQVKDRRMQSRERSIENNRADSQNDVSDNEIIANKTPVNTKPTKKSPTPTNIESQKSTAKFGKGLDDNTPDTSPGRGRSSDKILKKKGEPTYNRRDSVEENKAGDTSARLIKTPSNRQNLSNKPPTNLNQKNMIKPTNKSLIKNALTNVCLSGDFNKRDRELVFEKMDEIKTDNFIIVFKGVSGRHVIKYCYFILI